MMGNEFQEQYTPGLTNNQFRHFYAIATITQSFKKVCLRRHLCLLQCMILGIIMHCNINIKKNYFFLVLEFGEENQEIFEGGIE